MIAVVSIALLASLGAADNNPPVPYFNPGWTEGNNTKHIHIDAFYDLLCSSCKAYDPTFQEFLNSTDKEGNKWLDSISV